MTREPASPDDIRRSARWDARFGGKNFLALGGAQVAAAILSLTTLGVLSRSLGTEGYGQLAALMAGSMLLCQIVVSWTGPALVRYGCDEFVRDGHMRASFWTRTLFLGLSGSLCYASAPWWIDRMTSWLAIPGAGRIVLAHFTATAVNLHVQLSLQATKLPRVKGMLVAWSYVAMLSVSAFIGLVRVRKLVFPIEGPRWPLVTAMTAFSLPLILQSTFGYLSTNYIDAFFIVRWLSTASLGIYNITYQMMGSFLQLAVLAGSLVLPFLISLESADEHDSESRFLEETLPALCWGFSLACMLVAGAIVIAIPVLLPVSFGPTVELVWPMFAAAALAGPLVLGFAPLAMARSESRISAATAFVAACCNVVLNFALIPRFGVLGCVWATTASNFVTMAAAGLMVTRVRAFRYWRSILAALPPTLAAVAASHLRGGVLSVLLAIAAGGVALVVVGYGSQVSLSRVARSLQHALAAR